MIILRNSTAAFLRNNGKILLLKRSASKKIAPNVWAGVGGHMEAHEINNPLAACYREIEEETGITQCQISGLTLLYILIRRSVDEIRQTYFYLGETVQTDVIQTDEGELFWIPENELMNREFTQTFTAMLYHHSKRDPNNTAVYVGVADSNNGFKMNWLRCEDFE